jgi:hypothetical protein
MPKAPARTYRFHDFESGRRLDHEIACILDGGFHSLLEAPKERFKVPRLASSIDLLSRKHSMLMASSARSTELPEPRSVILSIRKPSM